MTLVPPVSVTVRGAGSSAAVTTRVTAVTSVTEGALNTTAALPVLSDVLLCPWQDASSAVAATASKLAFQFFVLVLTVVSFVVGCTVSLGLRSQHPLAAQIDPALFVPLPSLASFRETIPPFRTAAASTTLVCA